MIKLILNSVLLNKSLLLTLFCNFLISFSVSAAQLATPYTVAKRYNLSGQITGEISPDPDGSGALKFKAKRNFYNSQGLVYKVESGELSSWQNETIKPSNWTGFTKISIAEYYYNTRGQVIAHAVRNTSNAIRTFTQTSYDDYGRVECHVVRLSSSNFGNTGNNPCVPTYTSTYGYDRVTKYTYDSIGNVLTEYRAFGTPLQQEYITNTYYPSQPGLLESITDANGNTTNFEYDAYGRVEKRQYPGSGGYSFYTYDVNDNLIEERKRNGAIFEYSYDKLNRMIVKNDPDSTKRINYKYDLRGLQTSAVKGDFGYKKSITNIYDGIGNLKSSTSAEGYNSDANVRTLNYLYDLNGNRTHITHPDGTTFEYRFDGLNRVNKLLNDDNVQLLSVTYNASGRRSNISRNGGAQTVYSYDDIWRLNQFSQQFTSTSFNLTNSFTYNPASQITSISLSNSGYHYQGNMNILGTYTSNNLNQYTNIGGKVLSYDNNGNLTNDGGTYSYIFDNENRLVSIGGGASSSLEYDPLGRLYQVTINGISKQFLYDGDALIAEYDNSGSLIARYVHGDSVDEPWIQYTGNSTSLNNSQFLHSDHQRSVIAQSNSSGSVTTTQAYDTYGIPAAVNSGRFSYTGQIWFKELGLNYYKARIYHPKLGRFLQTDPVGYEDQMNLYAYVGNDPINKFDSTGLATEVNLMAYPLRSTGSFFGHAYLHYRDTSTGEERISRAGPSQEYPGGASAAAFDTGYDGVTILAGDSPAASSIDFRQEGAVTLQSVTLDVDIGYVKTKLDAFNVSINNLNAEYLPRSQNSNTYAGDAYEHVTGQAPRNNSSISLPGLTNTISNSDKGMSSGKVKICTGMGAQKDGCN